MLIFVFERVSYGRERPILADFAPVPNAHPVEAPKGEAVVEKDFAHEPGLVVDAAAGHRTTEHGGPSGPEPTRFGDWEKNGRCIDF